MFELKYANESDVPSEVKYLYKEVDGEWCITPQSEFKTISDVSRVQEGARKEREDHKATKEALKKFGTLDAEGLQEKMDRLEELESVSDGADTDDKINQRVEAKLKVKEAAHKRELLALSTQLEETNGTLKTYQQRETQRTISDTIVKAATQAKVLPEVISDAKALASMLFEVDDTGAVIAKEGSGLELGTTPELWLAERKTTSPYWWPESQGAGAKGGKGAGAGGLNPFSADGWNLTAQGEMLKTNRTQAENLARSAGTSIGGPRPIAKK